MLAEFRTKRETERVRVEDKYQVIGFISSGTYGRVYKAKAKKTVKRFDKHYSSQLYYLK